MKKLTTTLVILLVVFALIGCTSVPSSEVSSTSAEEETSSVMDSTSTQESETATQTTSSGQQYTIAYTTQDLTQDYWNIMECGVAQAAYDNGVTYIMQSHNNDATTLVSQVQSWINQKVDAIIMSPVNPAAVQTVVEQAHEAGIVTIFADMGDGGSESDDCLIISDNYGAGKQLAEYALEKAADAETKEFAIVRCPPSAIVAQPRNDAEKDVFLAAGWNCVSELYAQNGTPEESLKLGQDVLAANPDVSVIFAAFDDQAQGIIQACKAAGKDDVIVCGFDAAESGIAAIQAGTELATAQQYSYDMGYQAVVNALTVLNGGTIDYADPNAKTFTIPCAIITQDNVPASGDDFIVSSTGLTRGEMNANRQAIKENGY